MGGEREKAVLIAGPRFFFYAPISVFLAFYEEVCANQDYIQNATTQHRDGWLVHALGYFYAGCLFFFRF